MTIFFNECFLETLFSQSGACNLSTFVLSVNYVLGVHRCSVACNAAAVNNCGQYTIEKVARDLRMLNLANLQAPPGHLAQIGGKRIFLGKNDNPKSLGEKINFKRWMLCLSSQLFSNDGIQGRNGTFTSSDIQQVDKRCSLLCHFTLHV